MVNHVIAPTKSKQCTKCTVHKMLSSFHKGKSWCKVCVSDYMRFYIATTLKPPSLLSCTKCNETKPPAGYSKNKYGKYGLMSICKACDATRPGRKRMPTISRMYYIHKNRAVEDGSAYISKEEYTRLKSLQCDTCGIHANDIPGKFIYKVNPSMPHYYDNCVVRCRHCSILFK